MIKIRLFSRLVLLAISLVACAPKNGPVSSSPAVVSILNTSTPAAMATTDALTSTLLPIATSRGPELHATDPTTTNLASGGLQFVEFFRFT
jgi:hypothetical protein